MSAPDLTVFVTGGGAVTGDNLNTFVQSADTMAELRAFVGIQGIQVFVRGTAAPNDGGQGFFYWNVNGTAPDDNGVTTVVPYGSGSGEWTRLNNSISAIYQIFASNGTYTYSVPAGVYSIFLTVKGAGGGGGSSLGYDCGGGGGEGGTAIALVAVTPGQQLTIIVGAGGTGGVAGGNSGQIGGNSFCLGLEGYGGNGGVNNGVSRAGGLGGIATGGTANFTGGAGNDGNGGFASSVTSGVATISGVPTGTGGGSGSRSATTAINPAGAGTGGGGIYNNSGSAGSPGSDGYVSLLMFGA